MAFLDKYVSTIEDEKLSKFLQNEIFSWCCING